MNFTEKKLSGTRIYEGRIIRVRKDVVELPDGNIADREVVEHPGGVCMAAIDEQRNVYLVEQFRYPMGETTVELPAGKLEWDEDPDSAAVRELREETGFTARELRRVGVIYPSPGYGQERLYMYIARGLCAGEQELDDEEFLSVKKMPLAEAAALALNNTIKDAKTVALLLIADRITE